MSLDMGWLGAGKVMYLSCVGDPKNKNNKSNADRSFVFHPQPTILLHAWTSPRKSLDLLSSSCCAHGGMSMEVPSMHGGRDRQNGRGRDSQNGDVVLVLFCR